MPFLFVDYDQGAGGEYFCDVLSHAPECVTLGSFSTSTGRTKVSDVFHQEFLNLNPQVSKKSSDKTLYDIVPTHRQTQLAKDILGNIYSIRIKNPADPQLWSFLKHQQFSKVLLAQEPSDPMFIGQVRILNKTATNPDFLKQINKHMDNLTLTLISQGIDPTEENKKRFLDSLLVTVPEPECKYDLVIPYEDLFSNVLQVTKSIHDVFGISIDSAKLEKYKIDLNAYNSTT